MCEQNLNIVIAGVGGQGTVLASRVLAQVALNKGLMVRTSETIGMAQREGSVQSHVRIGSSEFGPVIGAGQADMIIGFEPAEAARAAGLLKNNGLMLVNFQVIRPVSVTLGAAVYPEEELEEFFKQLPAKVQSIKAFDAAVAAGSFRTVNTVMLGVMVATGRLPFSQEEVLQALFELLPQRVREVNERAFKLGVKL